MFESTQRFWYKLVFMTELLLGETLLVHRLKRRGGFAWRAAVAVAVCYAVAFFFPLPFYNAVYTSFLFLALFIVTVGGLLLCFDEPLVNILFCAIAAYSVQHIAYQLYNLIIGLTGLGGDATSGGLYEENSEPYYTVYTGMIYAMSYAFVYWLAFLLFANRIKKNGNLRIRSVALLLMLAVVVFVCIVINAVVTYNSYENYDSTYLASAQLSIIIGCVLALCLQFGLLSNRNLETELGKVYHLWREERRQYAASKANIDLINLKCHDLKHQIRRIGGGQMSERAMKEIEDAISIYDSSVKTGNSALDIILTDKSLLCGRNNITFTCVADGGRLGFIDDVDIYTLFGNALDNAIEAVLRLPDDMRVISLTTKENGDLFSVNLRNFYAGEVRFEGGLPVTTKSDRDYHGFGMKSIRNIVEKYGGDMSVSADGNVFSLNMLFGLSGE